VAVGGAGGPGEGVRGGVRYESLSGSEGQIWLFADRILIKNSNGTRSAGEERSGPRGGCTFFSVAHADSKFN
jgi:hypothetical protein